MLMRALASGLQGRIAEMQERLERLQDRAAKRRQIAKDVMVDRFPSLLEYKAGSRFFGRELCRDMPTEGRRAATRIHCNDQPASRGPNLDVFNKPLDSTTSNNPGLSFTGRKRTKIRHAAM
jgi:hypothetical protein